MDEKRRDDHGCGTERIGEDMQEDTSHIVSMVMGMVVRVGVAVMGMIEGHNSNEINTQSRDADSQEFSDAFHLRSVHETFYCLGDDFDADQPLGFQPCITVSASVIINNNYVPSIFESEEPPTGRRWELPTNIQRSTKEGE